MMQNDLAIPTVEMSLSPSLFDEVVKVRVVPAALLPLVATSRFRIFKEKGVLGNLMMTLMECLVLIQDRLNK